MEWYLINESSSEESVRCGQYPVCPSATCKLCATESFCLVEGGGGCSSKACGVKW